MIKLNQLDPDWELATKHGNASSIGYPNLTSGENLSGTLCPCCLHLLEKTPIPISVNSKELEFLGFGFPLFYSFLKNCMILMILLICSYNALELKKAIDTNHDICHPYEPHSYRLLETEKTCTSVMIELASLQTEVSEEEQIIRVASFIIQLLFLVYMRDHLTKLENYYDERNTSFADYSIMLKNIPKQKSTENKLREFFLRGFRNTHHIQEIVLLPEYPQLDSLEAERNKIIKDLREAYDKEQFSEEDIKNQQFLSKIDLAIEEEVQNCHQNTLNDEVLTSKAILVFNTDSEKSEILDEFYSVDSSKKVEIFGFKAEDITIKQAPQPRQILWKNVHVDKERKLVLYVTSWGLSLLTLVVVTIIFYFVLEQKSLNLIHAVEELQKDSKNEEYIQVYYGAIALVYVMLFLVILFNKLVMSTLFYKFTQIQRHETRSKQQFSFALKYLLGLFFTTALMTLAVEAIRFDNYYAHPYGVIEQETVMFILNAFFVPIFWILNPFAIAKYIRRKLTFGKRSLTQQQANNLMEPTHYDLGKRYAEIIEIMWFTFLYSTLIPLSSFISLAGMFLYYWVDKYTLLRKSTLRGEVSGKFVLTGMKLLDLTLILRPIGELVFDIQLRHQTGLISTVVMIAIGFLYFILPMDKIINIINPQMFKLEQKTYETVKDTFKYNYYTEHPIYKLTHVEKLQQKLEQKGLQIEHPPIRKKSNNTGVPYPRHQATSEDLTNSITISLKRINVKKQQLHDQN